MDLSGSADSVLLEGFRLDRRGGCLFRVDQGGVAVALGSRAITLLSFLLERRGGSSRKARSWRPSGPGGSSRKPTSTSRSRSSAMFSIRTESMAAGSDHCRARPLLCRPRQPIGKVERRETRSTRG
jgi:hypothetical protein